MVNDEGALEAFTGMLIALLLLLALTFATAFSLVNQYQRGRTAADLAALAAVGAVDPCGIAGMVAERNGARLSYCRPSATEIHLTARLPTGVNRLPLPRFVEVTARAGLPAPTASP